MHTNTISGATGYRALTPPQPKDEGRILVLLDQIVLEDRHLELK